MAKISVIRRKGKTAYARKTSEIESGKTSDMKHKSKGKRVKKISRRGKTALVYEKGVKVTGGR